MKFFFFWFIGLVCIVSQPVTAGTIVVVGDSLSAGYGIETTEGWVTQLNQKINSKYTAWRVINASISGDTTAGGLDRLPNVLKTHQPDIIILELGGNDGLRGLPPKEMYKNLSAMVSLSQAQTDKILVCGVRLPPNYGPKYNEAFAQVFRDIAQHKNVKVLEEILKNIDDKTELMQADGIHPKAAAQSMIVDNVLPMLTPWLTKADASSTTP